MMTETGDRPMELYPARTRQTGLLSLVAAYANIVACGFAYGTYNHEFELPLVNWLRAPFLYPNDPIREAFARFPTIFWPIVAYVSHWLSTERVIFLFFLLTKLVFFTALVRLVKRRVKDDVLTACIVLAVALSPFLNDLTPLGASNILDQAQTHTSLAVALLVWVGCFLLEGRWMLAAVLCALTIYLDALFYLFMLFAFATFAVLDWRSRRPAILLSGLLGAVISIPWLLIAQDSIFQGYPKGYVEALLAFYPFHLTLRSHENYELISAAGLVLAAGLIIGVARRTKLPRDSRLELLTASYLVPILLGSFFGEFFLTPTLARLQLLRADSFLVLYSILLIQIYGANLLQPSTENPATTFLLAALAILMPLSDSLGLVWALLVVVALHASAGERVEFLSRRMAGLGGFRLIACLLLLTAIALAARARADWSSTIVILLVIFGGCFFVYENRSGFRGIRIRNLTAVISIISLGMMAVAAVPTLSSLWNPGIVPPPLQRDWRAVQEWARTNTPLDAQFLVPTFPGGFRTFSERSSWGEWKDGQAMYHYPPFEDAYRKRMMAVGYSWWKWNETGAITARYKQLPWNQLLAIARQNHLTYIIQFRDVLYPAIPIFANERYSVYKVAY